jgi:hypothetical protein
VLYPPPSLLTISPQSCTGCSPLAPQWEGEFAPMTLRLQGWAMTEIAMTDKDAQLVREREEIAARVANFKATQQKFERERQEYYASTLGNAWHGYQRGSADTE